tara:strand:+ start:252 stop:449 length:198 start_codon:yes stop_codon:yes gene_type:complete
MTAKLLTQLIKNPHPLRRGAFIAKYSNKPTAHHKPHMGIVMDELAQLCTEYWVEIVIGWDYKNLE